MSCGHSMQDKYIDKKTGIMGCYECDEQGEYIFVYASTPDAGPHPLAIYPAGTLKVCIEADFSRYGGHISLGKAKWGFGKIPHVNDVTRIKMEDL